MGFFQPTNKKSEVITVEKRLFQKFMCTVHSIARLYSRKTWSDKMKKSVTITMRGLDEKDSTCFAFEPILQEKKINIEIVTFGDIETHKCYCYALVFRSADKFGNPQK